METEKEISLLLHFTNESISSQMLERVVQGPAVHVDLFDNYPWGKRGASLRITIIATSSLSEMFTVHV